MNKNLGDTAGKFESETKHFPILETTSEFNEQVDLRGDQGQEPVLGDKFWLEDPKVLWQSNRVLQFFPTTNMTLNEKLNASMRLGIYMSIVMMLVSSQGLFLFLGIFVALGTIYVKNNYRREVEVLSMAKTCTLPNVTNPMMNINLITDPKNKPKACPPTKEIKEEVDESFNAKLFRDVGDLYGKNNSQRQFYTMPSTTIPNDQTSFAKWLYQSGPTCKEQSRYCAPPWGMELGALT